MHSTASMASVPEDNHLIASLPGEQLDLLRPHLQSVALAQHTLLFEAGEQVEQVYFPHNGIVSLLAPTKSGRTIETAMVGRKGIVGGMVGLGLDKSFVRAVAQLPMQASRVPAPIFKRAVESSDVIRDLCVRYNERLLIQARVTAACNALHNVEARVCHWLLQFADRTESDKLALTQELLAEMLGVRRTSVTAVAGILQERGVISFSRGVIKILDRNALERASCECYHTSVEQSATLDQK